MPQPMTYATARRKVSLGAMISIPMGAVPVFAMGWIAHYGFPPAMRDSIRWMIVGPLYVMSLAGLVMGMVAIIRQRRMWWLGILGLLLNGLPLLVLVILIYRRYR